MAEERKKHFGYSLLLDIAGCAEGTLDDMNLCYQFLDDLVVFLKMNKQSEPTVVRTDHHKYPEKKGLSGWVPLVESGVQIHTLSVDNDLYIDVFSCREFNPNGVKEFITKYFKCEKIRAIFIVRGAHLEDSNP